MANPNQKTKRQLLNERMQSRYPDMNIEDDEEFSGRISDDMDNYENENAQYREREGALFDMFNADPRSASFLSSWKRGEDPAIQLIRQFGPELRDALDDPDKQEALAQANKEYVDLAAQNKQLEEEWSNNMQQSLSAIDAWQQEKGLSDEEVDAAIAACAEAGSNWIKGIVSPETLDKFLLAANHDGDVATARFEGEVDGRNAKIEEKLRNGKKGDGVPSGFGSGGTRIRKPGAMPPVGNSRTSGGSIWDRGNEKRTKRGM